MWLLYKIWDYEEFYLLGHNAVLSVESKPSKRPLTFNGLHDVISHKIQLFIIAIIHLERPYRHVSFWTQIKAATLIVLFFGSNSYLTQTEGINYKRKKSKQVKTWRLENENRMGGGNTRFAHT
jgi:hypothetical protein